MFLSHQQSHSYSVRSSPSTATATATACPSCPPSSPYRQTDRRRSLEQATTALVSNKRQKLMPQQVQNVITIPSSPSPSPPAQLTRRSAFSRYNTSAKMVVPHYDKEEQHLRLRHYNTTSSQSKTNNGYHHFTPSYSESTYASNAIIPVCSFSNDEDDRSSSAVVVTTSSFVEDDRRDDDNQDSDVVIDVIDLSHNGAMQEIDVSIVAHKKNNNNKSKPRPELSRQQERHYHRRHHQQQKQRQVDPPGPKSKVTFHHMVAVYEIPSRNDYTTQIQKALWHTPRDLERMIKRNTKEFSYENHKWQNVLEEHEMYYYYDSYNPSMQKDGGYYVHPAHIKQHGGSSNNSSSSSNSNNSKSRINKNDATQIIKKLSPTSPTSSRGGKDKKQHRHNNKFHGKVAKAVSFDKENNSNQGSSSSSSSSSLSSYFSSSSWTW